MIRLEKHDEIVEAMTARIYANIPDASALESQRAARNALDAMLEAVVRLEVGRNGKGWTCPDDLWAFHEEWDGDPDPIDFPALILKLEPKP